MFCVLLNGEEEERDFDCTTRKKYLNERRTVDDDDENIEANEMSMTRSRE